MIQLPQRFCCATTGGICKSTDRIYHAERRNAAFHRRAAVIASDPVAANGRRVSGLSLSHVEGLVVISRSSSFALATKAMDAREIGRRLNSGYLVGGSVQREGDRLRVNVHLVAASSGIMVWSSRFDRPLHEIYGLEDDISDQLADAIAARTGIVKAGPVVKERSHDVEAYLAFLKGAHECV